MKKLLIIILFALPPLIGLAQYFSAFATETSYPLGDCKLVRSWNTRGSVSVHEYTTGDRFVYTDFAGQCATVGTPFSLQYTDIMTGLRVNDMVIVDNYVFFCGMAGFGDYGVIGYFKVTQFFSGTINVTLHTYPTEVSFKKLVAYPDNLSYTVVALGSKRVSSSAPYPANDFIVEEQDILSTPPTPINIKYVLNANTGPNCEYYHDMVLLDNYIVLAGCYNSQQLCLRMADRSNVFSATVDSYHYYLLPANEINGNVVASALTKDSIAVAYVHPTQDNHFITRIRTIEIPSLKNTHSQEFVLGGKINPWDMIYSPMEKKLVLLMPEVNAVYPYSEFIRLDPYPTGTYTTESTYNKLYLFKTLDLFKGYDFVSSCANTWYFQNLYAPLPTPTGECPQDNSIKVEIISNINVQSFSNANPDSVTVSPATYPLNVNNGNLQLDCKHIWRNEK